MNFTFNIGELAGLIAGVLAVGAAFEKLRRLDRSVSNLGERMEKAGKDIEKLQAVEGERIRVNTAAHGIPVSR